jgi:hypothetical protein
MKKTMPTNSNEPLKYDWKGELTAVFFGGPSLHSLRSRVVLLDA